MITIAVVTILTAIQGWSSTSSAAKRSSGCGRSMFAMRSMAPDDTFSQNGSGNSSRPERIASNNFSWSPFGAENGGKPHSITYSITPAAHTSICSDIIMFILGQVVLRTKDLLPWRILCFYLHDFSLYLVCLCYKKYHIDVFYVNNSFNDCIFSCIDLELSIWY